MCRIGLEACSLTAWQHAGLTQAGLPAICMETRQAKAAMDAMPNKTDRNDARRIAQIMRTVWYRAVHCKSASYRSWRVLLTERRLMLNKRRCGGRRAGAAVRGRLEGRHAQSQEFPARVRELAADDPVLASLSGSLLCVSHIMNQEVERLTKRVLDEVKVEPAYWRLMTVPGVGPLTPLAFRATIDQLGGF